ncbi:MAG: preprotein translocase subunit SecE [Deltaproteobacteria bacterium]|nr:preprotein translocase subunit SecE [Deltaproteobacteria bacterium]
MRTSRQYLSDVRSEMRKVTWPTQREYVGGTIGVVVILALMTLVLGIVDYVLAQGIRLIVP